MTAATAYALGDPHLITTGSALRRAGASGARIEAQLASGRWRRWGHAIALHNGPLSPQQRWFVGLVHGGPQSVLTSFTAAEVFGLSGWGRAEIHVLVPRGAKRVPGCPVPMILHRARDWTTVRRLPRAPIHARADALLVAAASFRSARPACGLLAAGVQQDVVTTAELTDALDRAQRVRHRRAMRAAVGDIGQGAQALGEIDFVRLCRRHGLPPPRLQAVRIESSGRRRYLDASWTRSDGQQVAVEVDGAIHLNPRRWWDDQLRQNEIVLGGVLVLRYPSVVVRAEELLVAGQLRRALRI